jgi:3-oxoacyl-[acyl-carrier-protein] synthase III
MDVILSEGGAATGALNPSRDRLVAVVVEFRDRSVVPRLGDGAGVFVVRHFESIDG